MSDESMPYGPGYYGGCGQYLGTSELAMVEHMERCATCAPSSPDSEDNPLDDCSACDAPLSTCARDEACCDDCTHGGNLPSPDSGSEQ